MRSATVDWEWWYLTKNESIEYHHCASNDENAPVEDVLTTTTDDDHRLDDLNKLDVTTFPVAEVGVQAIVVDSVMGVVVVVAAVGEDDEDVRNDEARQMDLIATMMMIEAKKIRTNRCEREREIERDGQDRTHRFDLMGEIVRRGSRGPIWTMLIVR